MSNKSHQINMTEGPIMGKIIAFAIPLMLTSLLQLLYNAADVVVVGKFAGDQSLAAVGSTTSLINLLINLFMGMSVGAGVIISQSIGAKNKERLTATVHTAMLLSVIIGFFVGTIGFFISKKVLLLMGTPDDVIHKATLYIKIYFLGLPGLMIYNFGASILRAAGDTKRPLYILTLSGIINVLCNLVFVIVFKMDVVGVATATILSQYISAVRVVVILLKDNADYRLSLSKLKIHRKSLSQIISYGLPMGIQNSLFSFSNVLIQSSINSFGSTIMAGNAAAINIEGFVYVASDSGAQATLSFVGQNFGAKKYDRILKVVFCSAVLSLVMAAIFSGFTVLFRESLLGIYTDSAQVIAAGSKRLLMITSCQAICGIMGVMANAARGMGKSIVPMVSTLFFVCVLRIVCVYTVFARFHTIEVLYASYPITWLLAIIAHSIYFAKVFKKEKSKI